MSQSLSARRARSRRRQKRMPIGMIAAMLTACATTLIGVVCGLDPFVVLIRVIVSAIGMGLLVSIGVGIINLANIENQQNVAAKRQQRRNE